MLQRTRADVQGIEQIWPFYAPQLRLAARESMSAADLRLSRTALAVLAAIGTVDDVLPLRRLADAGSPHHDDIRRAVTEIENREALGLDPMRMVEVSPLRDSIGRTVLSLLGCAAIAGGLYRTLLDWELGHRGIKDMLGGLSLLGGAVWLLLMAWTPQRPRQR